MKGGSLIARFGASDVYRLDPAQYNGVLSACWVGKYDVDADGSPHAYAPAGSGLVGLDFLRNAMDGHGGWCGIAVDDHGRPFVQHREDPAPGYYVSTTALKNPAVRYPSDPKRYVDSAVVPFGVIPGGPLFGRVGFGLGDVGIAMNLETQRWHPFIIGDIGPVHSIGEGSIALADKIGVPSSAKTGGVAHGIAWLLFSRVRSGWLVPEAAHELGVDSLTKWGGIDRLKNLTYGYLHG